MPPGPPTIMDANRTLISQVAGPYVEGEKLRLLCIVKGGMFFKTVHYKTFYSNFVDISVCTVWKMMLKLISKMIQSQKFNILKKIRS